MGSILLMKKSDLSLTSRIQYIWDYYKVPLFTAALLIYIICYIIFRHATDRDILLYVAAVNTPVQKETEDFINSFPKSDYAVPGAGSSAAGPVDAATGPNKQDIKNPKTSVVSLAKDLYLTSDPDSEYHQYVYASRLKILASIEAEKLDIVLADREAMDAFAAQGFLMPLESVFADDPQILARLETGTVILEDNQIEVMLDESVSYEAVTRSEKAYLDLSDMTTLPGMPEGRPVYIGIIANTPRQDMAVAFVRRLFAE